MRMWTQAPPTERPDSTPTLRGLPLPFVWSEVKALLGRYRGQVAALGLASVVAGFSESGVLAILAQSAAALVNHTSRIHLDLGLLQLHATVGGLLAAGVALALIRLGLQIVIALVPARLGDDAQARLRHELFSAFIGASWDQQSRDREGHLQELLTNQLTAAVESATAAAALIVSLLTFVVLVFSALALNVYAALLVLVTAVALSALLRPLGGLGQRRAQALSQAYMAHAGGVNEAVRLAEETHVFGVEAAQRGHIDDLIGAIRGPNVKVRFISRLVPGIYQSLIYLFVVIALICLYAIGTAHVASLGAVVLLLVRAGAYGQQSQSSVQVLRQSQPYVERLQEALGRYHASRPVTGELALNRVDKLGFENVTYSYGRGRPALLDVTFEVQTGDAIGIVGPSGAGKSTLVQILLGLRDPDLGAYLVNGVPAPDYDRADWRTRFAYVPQEPRLLHASVSDNIRFYRQIDDGAVEQAARLAGIHDEILDWPTGYETLIGPRADAISGGQQQRICLARALAAKPEVLVLDEPTSALDPRAEQVIQESLIGLKDKLTLFIVAHRMSTLDICERVMVVVDGRLQAFDRIDELRRNNAYYKSAISLASQSPGVSVLD